MPEQHFNSSFLIGPELIRCMPQRQPVARDCYEDGDAICTKTICSVAEGGPSLIHGDGHDLQCCERGFEVQSLPATSRAPSDRLLPPWQQTPMQSRSAPQR